MKKTYWLIPSKNNRENLAVTTVKHEYWWQEDQQPHSVQECTVSYMNTFQKAVSQEQEQ